MIEKVTVPGAIELDRFDGASAPAQVLSFGPGAAPDLGAVPRAPHRHDYHELFLVRAGRTEHRIDDDPVVVGAGQVLLIGRGQVHRLERSEGLEGAIVRFGEELVVGAAQAVSPGWMLISRGHDVLEPPSRELEHALAQAAVLHDELRRPPDVSTDRIVAAGLTVLLSLVERWQAGSVLDARAAGTSDSELLRRFVRLLEAEHQRHHDAGWYAGELAVSSSHLAAVLTRLTGRSTKRMITDRLMIEVARLLRFTDLTVQQVALRLGYEDPLYLSRAFKAHTGQSPSAWRAQRTGELTAER